MPVLFLSGEHLFFGLGCHIIFNLNAYEKNKLLHIKMQSISKYPDTTLRLMTIYCLLFQNVISCVLQASVWNTLLICLVVTFCTVAAVHNILVWTSILAHITCQGLLVLHNNKSSMNWHVILKRDNFNYVL